MSKSVSQGRKERAQRTYSQGIPTARQRTTSPVSNQLARLISSPPLAPAAPPTSTWGAQIMRRLSPTLTLDAPRLTILRRRLTLIAPLFIVAVVLILAAWGHYTRQQFYHRLGGQYKFSNSVAAFADLNYTGAARLGIRNLARSDMGYDGQFYYFIAYRPAIIATCHTAPANCPLDNPALREERIFYPMTAWLVSLGGNPSLLPFALLLVNFIAILLMTLLVGQLSVEAGYSRWVGLAAGLFCGTTFSLLADLADPYATFWVVLAIYLLRHRRYVWSAVAVAAALLTREQLIFYLPLLSLPLIAERRWRTLTLSAVIALGPFILWQLTLHALYGQWALISGDTGAAHLVPIPFGGLFASSQSGDFGEMLLNIGVPLALTILIALYVIWHDGPRSLLRDPVPLMALLYCALYSFTYYFNWGNTWTAARLALPGVILGVLVALRLRSPSWRGAYLAIVALSVLAPLIVILQEGLT